MIIFCHGADSFRALRKIQELEKAFREKYDPSGYAVERIAPGKDGWKEVIQRANAVGLFASRKCIRVDGLWKSCPKKERDTMKRVLEGDPERVIILSLEEEMDEVETRECMTWPKAITYPFPVLRGKAHQEHAEQLAKELGGIDAASVAKIAQYTEGDSWLLWNELTKSAAVEGIGSAYRPEREESIFQQSDRYFFEPARAHLFQESLDAAEILPVFLQQGRTGLRVKSGASEGISSFAARKWQTTKMSLESLKQRVARLIQATYLQRCGVAGEVDLDALL